MTLPDCAAIATIIGALGTFVAASAACVVSCAALRTQREALPVSAIFGLTGCGYVDTNDVRWLEAWMQNTGVTAYAHEVYRYEWHPLALPAEQLPDVARVEEPGSMPEFLRSKSKRELREKAGVFEPGYLPPGQYSMFYVFCPPGVERVKIAVTMSVKRRGLVRFISSEWLDVPSADDLRGLEEGLPSCGKAVACRRNGSVGPAEGAGE